MVLVKRTRDSSSLKRDTIYMDRHLKLVIPIPRPCPFNLIDGETVKNKLNVVWY